jgi:hypothetical protein
VPVDESTLLDFSCSSLVAGQAALHTGAAQQLLSAFELEPINDSARSPTARSPRNGHKARLDLIWYGHDNGLELLSANPASQ